MEGNVLKPLYSFAGSGVVVGSNARARRRRSRPISDTSDSSGARRFPPRDRDALRPDEDRGPHHVSLAGRTAPGEHDHPHGAGPADGRGSQQGLEWVGASAAFLGDSQ